MKRQRSRAELLLQLKIYNAMVEDSSRDINIRGGVQRWCTEVAWVATLNKIEKFSSKNCQEFLKYMREYDISELDEEHRNKIRDMLKLIGIPNIEARPIDQRRKNSVDSLVSELHKYNAKTMSDYRLLACEYLHKYKGFGKKRLMRDINYSIVMENAGTERLQDIRQELYDRTNIWLSMCPSDEPENDMEKADVKTID